MNGGPEVIAGGGDREIGILAAAANLTITRARYAASLAVAGPHVHHDHADAFYVLEGELTFELGRERETVTIAAGGFVAVPPGVAHAVRNEGDVPAAWLTIHAPDGGFAGFMRGLRDGVHVEWDIAEVPVGGGLPSSAATVVSPPSTSWASGYPARAIAPSASSRRSSGSASARPATTAARSVPLASR